MEGSHVGLPRRDDHDQGGGQTKDQSGNDELGDDSAPQAAYLRRAVLDRSEGHHRGREDPGDPERHTAPRRRRQVALHPATRQVADGDQRHDADQLGEKHSAILGRRQGVQGSHLTPRHECPGGDQGRHAREGQP